MNTNSERTVVVVDDYESLLGLIGARLEMAGFKPILCLGIEEGRKALSSLRNAPAAVIAGLSFKGTTRKGTEITRYAHSLYETYIILMSGDGIDGETREYGCANDYVGCMQNTDEIMKLVDLRLGFKQAA